MLSMLSRHFFKFIVIAGWVSPAMAFMGASFVKSGHPLYLNVFAGALSGPGSLDGTGAAARFNGPNGIGMDSSGNLYIADTSNAIVRKVTTGAAVTTFAGAAEVKGNTNGIGSAASFQGPMGVVVDSSGNVYVSDNQSHVIRKITSSGSVSIFAGAADSSGTTNSTNTPTNARFNQPEGLAMDSSGNIYVADKGNAVIRMINPSTGAVTTFAGTMGVQSYYNGSLTSSNFNQPTAVAVDSSGNVYVADTGNQVIRKISGSLVSTIAGIPSNSGYADGSGATAKFSSPQGLTVDTSGNLYVADTGNHVIRKIVISSMQVSTLAGNNTSMGGADGTGTAANFGSPTGIFTDNTNLWVMDNNYNTLRKIVIATTAVTTFAGTTGGSTNGTGAAALFNLPSGMSVDSSGNIYIADTYNDTIRKITPGGVVTLLAGQVGVSGAANGAGTASTFSSPFCTAVDPSGNVYVADTGNSLIRKITTGGTVSNFAGTGSSGYGDNNTGTSAVFSYPQAIISDPSGNLYVGDGQNFRIRKITSAGAVTTVAGSGTSQSVDGSGTAASFGYPAAMAMDASGNIYVADSAGNTIRKIDTSFNVTTIAGSAGVSGFTDGQGSAALFNTPNGIAVGSNGIIYVADTANNAIRRVTPGGKVTTVVGTNTQLNTVLGSVVKGAALYAPFALTAVGGMLYIVTGNSVLRVPQP